MERSICFTFFKTIVSREEDCLIGAGSLKKGLEDVGECVGG
jgi:hypothetical protein